MVKEGYKKTKYGLIPDSWDFLQLKDIAKVNMGSSPPSSTYNEDGDGLPFFQGNAEFGSIYPEENQWCTEPQKVADKDNILISVRAPVGDINIAPYKCCIGRGLAAIEGEETSDKFIYYYLKQFNPKLQSYSQGSTFSSINKKVLETFFVNYPPLLEQKKIASILSSVDKSIEKTDEVIEETKELKKGLMQELLTKGIGHSDFKEVLIGVKKYNIPKSWELRRIESFTDEFISGGTPSTDEEDFWGGDIHFITGAYIKDREIEQGKDLISKKGLENSSSNLIPKDNVIICTRTAVGNIGKNIIDIAISQDVTGIILDKKEIDVDYFIWSIIRFKYLLKVYQQGSTIKGITRNVLENFKVPLPSLEEQKKIASILVSVDNKIQKEEEYKEKLENLKKGLMQKLLTGEIRVNTDMEV